MIFYFDVNKIYFIIFIINYVLHNTAFISFSLDGIWRTEKRKKEKSSNFKRGFECGEDERRVEMKFLIDSDILIDVLKGVNKV